ncbi:hypothetical protein Pla175_12040 [Pirellulimonas nuda]|uniref:HigA2-like helix-turn-helix domain-containing protein n=1 Tax=Pirellulimonas nuda TaxID=2528009 RepID=A0A518D8N6_9BACT|nr:helix-turn-helix transcriptional regulator [Pirellulimonas nuda]QDU87837.1 hypothetical protein Pla175_12040 [Pirellulimonas nuda]
MAKKAITKAPRVSTVETLFEDIGFSAEEAAVLRLKTTLHIELMKIIRKRKLSPKGVGELLGMKQPNVSKLLGGNLDRTSSDRLTRYLSVLGQEVRVEVGKAP